mgnify:FL=1
MDMKNLKSNEDEDIEKICIAFGMSKAELKLKLKCLEAYPFLRNKDTLHSVPRITPFVANSILIRSIAHTFIKLFHSKSK